MKLVKSLLLSAPAALLAVGAVSAADLPSKKASPVSYVTICDAYGAGFFFIPGTDTCLKVGGYVRAEYSIQQRGNQATSTTAATTYLAKGEDLAGFRVRGRVDMDARTQSAWGTVRTVFALRTQSQSGLYVGGVNGGGPAAAPTIEAAYVQFAGFTAGRAADNFAFMPGSTHFFSGGNQWAGFPAGVKQLAYTATFGGGFSATLALVDRFDMLNAANIVNNGVAPVVTSYPQTMPVVEGNLRVDQAWGSAQIMGAVQKNEAYISNAIGSVSTTGWAVGAGVKFNLPMLAAGDQLWLTAAYADGFNDMTIGNGATSNTADQFNMLRGFQRVDNSYAVVGNSATSYAAQNEKTWSVGGALVHYWAPTWRSIVGASYGNYKPGSTATTVAGIGSGTLTSSGVALGGLSKADLYNVTASLIWSPVPNLDVGAEVQYRKIKQSVDATSAAYFATNGVTVSPSDWGARLRVQRTF